MHNLANNTYIDGKTGDRSKASAEAVVLTCGHKIFFYRILNHVWPSSPSNALNKTKARATCNLHQSHHR